VVLGSAARARDGVPPQICANQRRISLLVAPILTQNSLFADLFRDLFFLGFDGADDGAEGRFSMLLGAFRWRRCSWNQWVTVLGPLDTEEVVGSNSIAAKLRKLEPHLDLTLSCRILDQGNALGIATPLSPHAKTSPCVLDPSELAPTAPVCRGGGPKPNGRAAAKACGHY